MNPTFLFDILNQDDNPNHRRVYLTYKDTEQPYNLVTFGESALQKYYVLRHFNGVPQSFGPIDNDTLPFSIPGLTLGEFISNRKTSLSTSENVIKSEMKSIIRDIGVTHFYCVRNEIELDLSATAAGDIIDGIFVDSDDKFPRVMILPIRKSVDAAKSADNWKWPLVRIYDSILTSLVVNDRVRADSGFCRFINKLRACNGMSEALPLFNSSSFYFWSEYKKTHSITKLKNYVDKYPHYIHKLNPQSSTGWANLKNCRDQLETDDEIGAVVQNVARRVMPHRTETYLRPFDDTNALIKLLRDLFDHFERNFPDPNTFPENKGVLLAYLELKFPLMMDEVFSAAYYASIDTHYPLEFDMEGY